MTECTQSRRVSRVGLDVYLELVDHLVHLKVLGRVLSARGASPGLYLPSVRAVDHRVEVHDMLSILEVERLRAVVLFLQEGEGGPERRAVRNQQQRQSDPEAKATLASRGVPHGDPILPPLFCRCTKMSVVTKISFWLAVSHQLPMQPVSLDIGGERGHRRV